MEVIDKQLSLVQLQRARMMGALGVQAENMELFLETGMRYPDDKLPVGAETAPLLLEV